VFTDASTTLGQLGGCTGGLVRRGRPKLLFQTAVRSQRCLCVLQRGLRDGFDGRVAGKNPKSVIRLPVD
jgi:hypothetical protein